MEVATRGKLHFRVVSAGWAFGRTSSVRQKRCLYTPHRRTCADPTLPDSNHLPARSPELSRHSCVTPSVRIDLEKPEIAVDSRHPIVLRTSVPEAPVNKHGNALPAPCEIRATREWKMSTPTRQLPYAKDTCKRLLGSLVLPPLDRAHDSTTRLGSIGKSSRLHWGNPCLRSMDPPVRSLVEVPGEFRESLLNLERASHL